MIFKKSMDEEEYEKTNKAEWGWALASYAVIISLCPDKEAALNEPEKLRKAGPSKGKTE